MNCASSGGTSSSRSAGRSDTSYVIFCRGWHKPELATGCPAELLRAGEKAARTQGAILRSRLLTTCSPSFETDPTVLCRMKMYLWVRFRPTLGHFAAKSAEMGWVCRKCGPVCHRLARICPHSGDCGRGMEAGHSTNCSYCWKFDRKLDQVSVTYRQPSFPSLCAGA